jgi:hypothetical protein
MVWAMWVAYDIVVSQIGWFPAHPISERLDEDIKIALFIVCAYFKAREGLRHE